MANIFELTERPKADLIFKRNDPNDPRMGEVVGTDEKDLQTADIVILGCQQDEGVVRNHGRTGAAKAPDAIREHLYRLTTFNLRKKVFDLGNIRLGTTLEETHETQKTVVTELLKLGKRVVVIGGGGDISYPDGKAMADAFGNENWLAVNINPHLGVRIADQINSGTPFRQLLEEEFLLPNRFFEVGYQTHVNSPIYYEHLRKIGVQRISLELLRSRSETDYELKELIKQKFVHHSSSISTFFGFDLSVVRASDAPGTSAPSPLGLRAGEFIQLVKYSASLANTKLVEFTEVNPDHDSDDRTVKLVAIAIHRFCTGTGISSV